MRVAVVPQLETGLQPPLEQPHTRGVHRTADLDLRLVDETYRRDPTLDERLDHLVGDPPLLVDRVSVRRPHGQVIHRHDHPTVR